LKQKECYISFQSEKWKNYKKIRKNKSHLIGKQKENYEKKNDIEKKKFRCTVNNTN
jgi:hypothetical protein